jgi:ComF family protein
LALNPPPAPSWCTRADVSVSHVRALGHYTSPFSNLVHQLKYYDRRSLAPALGRPMAGLMMSDATLKRAELIVPIPLHPARFRERGYNQSQLLAEQVSQLTRVPWNDALKRVRNTRDQVNLKDEARRKNLEGAFALRPEASVRNQKVLLIDDVATTGATLNSAAKALILAGATEVVALVVAAT